MWFSSIDVPQTRIRNAAGTLQLVTRIRIRDEDNNLRNVSKVSVRDASNSLRVVWQIFTATVTPGNVTGYSSTGSAASITTSSSIAAPVGGTSPFTYAWTQFDSSAYTWTIASPTAASTSFTVSSLPSGVSTSCIFKVTITDAAGAVATAYVEAIANNGQPYSPTPRLEGRLMHPPPFLQGCA
jgi:hypothetical protein